MPKAKSIPGFTAQRVKRILTKDIEAVTTITHGMVRRSLANDELRRLMAHVLIDALKELCEMDDLCFTWQAPDGELGKRDKFMIDLEANLDKC